MYSGLKYLPPYEVVFPVNGTANLTCFYTVVRKTATNLTIYFFQLLTKAHRVMDSPEKVVTLDHLWYYTTEVASLLESSKSKFEREIRPHRRELGPKFGMRWSNVQVKKILYLLAPDIHVVIV